MNAKTNKIDHPTIRLFLSLLLLYVVFSILIQSVYEFHIIDRVTKRFLDFISILIILLLLIPSLRVLPKKKIVLIPIIIAFCFLVGEQAFKLVNELDILNLSFLENPLIQVLRKKFDTLGFSLILFAFYFSIVSVYSNSQITRQDKNNLEEEMLKRDELEKTLRLSHSDLEKKLMEQNNEMVLALRDLEIEIQQRKDTESELLKSESRYRTLINNTSDLVWLMDSEGILKYVSPTVKKMFGFSPEEVVGKSYLVLLSEEETPQIKESLNRRKRGEYGKQGITIEMKHKRMDNSTFFGETRTTPIYDEQGNLVEIVGITRDITPRKKVEMELKESEERFSKIVQSSPMGIYLYELQEDDRLVLIDANPAADVQTGTQNQLCIGKTIEEAFPELASTEVPQRYRDVARNGSTWQTTNFFYKDDRIRGAFDVYAFQTSENRMAAMFLEITDRIKLEEQLRQSQKMEAIGQLAGGIAHDFNNLLTGIIGYSDILLKRIKSQNSTYTYVEEIKKAGERASSLTRQLLAFSRKQILAPKVLNINTLLSNMETMIQRLIGEDVQFSIVYDPHLGFIKADPGQVEQIVMNLVVNSRDAMPKGGKLSIETANIEYNEPQDFKQFELPAGSYIQVRVRDNGCGISSENLNHIFEPFFTTKQKEKGTGLGLSTVYGIVKQSGGYISVESEEGQGTEFCLFFPQVFGEVENIDSYKETTANLSGTETILVVEDDLLVRNLICDTLEEMGYHTIKAESGTKALELVPHLKEHIHLLITDIVLPKMKGFELSKSLQTMIPDLKILFISGYTEETMIQQGIMEENINFLLKPFQTEVLLKKVAEILH